MLSKYSCTPCTFCFSRTKLSVSSVTEFRSQQWNLLVIHLLGAISSPFSTVMTLAGVNDRASNFQPQETPLALTCKAFLPSSCDLFLIYFLQDK